MEKIKRIKYFLFGLLMLAVLIIVFSMLYDCIKNEVCLIDIKAISDKLI